MRTLDWQPKTEFEWHRKRAALITLCTEFPGMAQCISAAHGHLTVQINVKAGPCIVHLIRPAIPGAVERDKAPVPTGGG